MGLTYEESINLYQEVGERTKQLFDGLYDLCKKPPLSSVDTNLYESLALTKLKLNIFNVLVDDVADRMRFRNFELLNRLLAIPWEEKPAASVDQYYDVTNRMWVDILASIRGYPRFEEFKQIFYFDMKQVMNASHYSWLINSFNYCNNFLENSLYVNHGVMIIVHGMLELMCSPSFDRTEMGTAREIFHLNQQLSSNMFDLMFHTYRSEIREKDLSSPLISHAINRGLITQDDFLTMGAREIEERVAPLEAFFREVASDYIQRLEKYDSKIRSFDLRKFIDDKNQILREYIWKDF